MDKKAETPETIEQAITRLMPEDEWEADSFMRGFTAGAEWQQKRSFSLEDARRIWEDGQDCENPDTEKQIDGEWKKSWTFDQFMEDNYPEKPKD